MAESSHIVCFVLIMSTNIIKLVVITLAILLAGCATVRQEDLDAWIGQPVVSLESHPVFLSVPVVKTQVPDGTEIWNYVNGLNIGHCSGGGNIYAGKIDFATYNKFANCIQKFPACNNIFYIRNGKVMKYTPIGTGGANCYTNEKLQPGFNSTTNIQ